MADVLSQLRQWSGTASSNKPADTDIIGSGLADNIRTTQAVIKNYLAGQSSTVVPSAGVADLTTATGIWVPISGNSTITGFGTEPAGIWYKCVLTGSPPILNNANISTPGGVTIAGGVGDVFIADSQGSGVWRIHAYSKAASTAFDGTSLSLIQSLTAANAASVSFTTGINSAFDTYALTIANVVPQTDNTDLYLLASTDGGSNYLAGTNYAYEVATTNGGTVGASSSTGTAQFLVANALGTSTGEVLNGMLWLQNLANASVYKSVHGTLTYFNATPAVTTRGMGCMIKTTSAINAIRLQMSSGNINGTFSLYGVRKA